MKTKRGIYYDLEESTYKSSYDIYDRTYTFVFSSKCYQDKFDERLDAFIDSNMNKVKKITGCLIRGIDMILAIELYKSIEKRGFLIYETDLNNNTLKIHAFQPSISLNTIYF